MKQCRDCLIAYKVAPGLTVAIAMKGCSAASEEEILAVFKDDGSYGVHVSDTLPTIDKTSGKVRDVAAFYRVVAAIIFIRPITNHYRSALATPAHHPFVAGAG